MNVLLLHTHDTGRFIGPYGFAADTPCLSALAREGALFRQAFSAAPTCSPSRAALMTGQYPHECGMYGLAHRGFSLPNYSHHLAGYLRRFGFETVLCGIQHEAPDAGQIGYTRILDDQNFDMGNIEFDSIAFDRKNAALVCDYLRAPHEAPFFLSFGMYNTHRRWMPHDPRFDPRYLAPFPGMCDVPENRRDMADFLHSVNLCDTLVGQVLQTLEETGQKENTLVIFTTDHGPAVPDMKCTLYDLGTGISLILRRPGTAGGQCIDTPVSNLDLFPTICDICRLEKPSWLSGQSLAGLLTGGSAPAERAIFSEINYHAAYQPARAVRAGRYKYIRHFLPAQSPILANVDNCPEKTFLFEQGVYAHRQTPGEELFDLYADPGEKENLAFSERYAARLADMRRQLLHWMESTDDPLLAGSVAAPAGARINSPDDYCAEDLKEQKEGAV